VVDYAQIAVPTYPSGQIGCLMCSINPVCDTCNSIVVLCCENCKPVVREKWGLFGDVKRSRGTTVERRSLARELYLSCSQPVADG